MNCKICNIDCKSTKSLLFHIKYSHKLTTKEYYDLFNEKGYCKICGKPTNFINFNDGYREYCSAKCSANSIKTKQKRENTTLEKYGCKNISQQEDIKKKKVEKYKEQVDKIKEKVKETNRKRYGCDWITQSDEFKEQYKKSCLDKYGVDNYTKSPEYKDKTKQTHNQYIQFMLDNEYIPLVDINMKFGTGWHQQNRDKIVTYKNKGYIHSSLLKEIEEYSKRVNSKFQQEVFDYINDTNAIQNTRKIISPYELDIYIPNKNLAIECDGVYWHSQYDKNYHLLKTELCEDKNIRLIHITDWLWNNKQNICKSIIDNALNRNQTIIYARKCIIKNVSNKDAKQFLNDNHIQGEINASLHIGLYYNNELVQIISLGKSRYKKNEYELYRMCSKLNTNVIGGFSKLLNQIKEPLVSYVDRALFTGIGYEKSGWIKQSITPPSYSYYKQNIKLSRNQTQKHKLSKLLQNFDPNKSEKQNMLDNEWLILFDCGTFKYIRR